MFFISGGFSLVFVGDFGMWYFYWYVRFFFFMFIVKSFLVSGGIFII